MDNSSLLVSTDEEIVAETLKKANLNYVNCISNPVLPKNTFYTRIGKRVIDIIIAFPAVVLLLPLNIVLLMCTFFDVGKPVFYKQVRVGMGGKRFQIVKFRNMNNAVDKDGRLLPPAQRVTKFGKLMRKYSLDELLSFWNVLKGDMSIIGPRPQPEFVYDRMSNRHRMRTAVRPGLECPRIIHVSGEEICKYHRTFENDIWYIENISLALDVKMLFKLISMTFSMEQRGKQASGNGISYFVGYNENGIAISYNVYKELKDRNHQ